MRKDVVDKVRDKTLQIYNNISYEVSELTKLVHVLEFHDENKADTILVNDLHQIIDSFEEPEDLMTDFIDATGSYEES